MRNTLHQQSTISWSPVNLFKTRMPRLISLIFFQIKSLKNRRHHPEVTLNFFFSQAFLKELSDRVHSKLVVRSFNISAAIKYQCCVKVTNVLNSCMSGPTCINVTSPEKGTVLTKITKCQLVFLKSLLNCPVYSRNPSIYIDSGSTVNAIIVINYNYVYIYITI